MSERRTESRVRAYGRWARVAEKLSESMRVQVSIPSVRDDVAVGPFSIKALGLMEIDVIYLSGRSLPAALPRGLGHSVRHCAPPCLRAAVIIWILFFPSFSFLSPS